MATPASLAGALRFRGAACLAANFEVGCLLGLEVIGVVPRDCGRQGEGRGVPFGSGCSARSHHPAAAGEVGLRRGATDTPAAQAGWQAERWRAAGRELMRTGGQARTRAAVVDRRGDLDAQGACVDGRGAHAARRRHLQRQRPGRQALAGQLGSAARSLSSLHRAASTHRRQGRGSERCQARVSCRAQQQQSSLEGRCRPGAQAQPP